MSPIPGSQSRFLLDASVCIAEPNRAGLERLLPTPGMEELEPRLEQRPSYCARPPFALERIEQVNEDRIVYRLPQPQRDGRTALSFTPLEFTDHLAARIPPP